MGNAKRIQRIFHIICLVSFANCFACAIVSYWIGGDGWGGYVEAGRHFVGSHGFYTEVSRATFVYSKVHLVVSMVLLPIGAITGVIAALIRDHLSCGENRWCFSKTNIRTGQDVILE